MIDLLALLEDGLRAKPERGDEHRAHMSDGICDRMAWARRKGFEMLPRAFPTLVKFELGEQFERAVADELEEELTKQGFRIRRDVECSLYGVVGHVDFVAKHDDESRDFILELKSTSFLRGKVPEEASSWYAEQTALYAAALDVARFGVLVGCRESGKLAPVFWFGLDEQRYDEPQTWRDWAFARASELAVVTDPGEEMPPAEPRTAWACKTCLWAGCEKNPAYVDTDLIAKLEASYAGSH